MDYANMEEMMLMNTRKTTGMIEIKQVFWGYLAYI